MLAELLYFLIPYQIFKSVFFRSGLTYLTTYFLINFFIPKVIRLFRREGVTSDFTKEQAVTGPYSGATPIMGGIVLIPSVVVSTLLWAWINKYTVALLIIISAFSLIGAIDDIAKVFNKRKVEVGKAAKKRHTDKADGVSGIVRLIFEFLVTGAMVAGIFLLSDGLDGHVLIPRQRLILPETRGGVSALRSSLSQMILKRW